ncbi:MAG TPA: ArgE/DapE family deacylase [Thermoanaerobaculia bacterium]|nr:ArgE/DapE family deacylase [Thermoanaerobaculia bacterium]
MTPRDAILRAVSSYTEEMIDFTSRLTAISTENPPGREYAPCVEAIAAELRRIGLPAELIEIAATGPRPDPNRCIRSFYGPPGRTLYFHGHYDVVPAASPGQFLPRREGGKLFARGSADMKGGLAAMIYAVRAIKDCGIALAGRLGLLIVPDEETGGARGSGPLARAGILGESGIGMLTPEPSGDVVWNACRGAISLRVHVRGKSSHVGLHFQGANAFEGMIDLANRLLELKEEVETRETGFRIAPEAARRSVLLLGGECTGGAGYNIVPDRMSFTIDRRINPEEDLEEEKRRLLALIEAPRPGLEVGVEVLQEAPASSVTPDQPLARALARGMAQVTGQAPRFELCPGLLETRFYAAKGVPALAYGPGSLSVSHGAEEFVEVEKVSDCTAIYALTALDLLSG